MKKNILPFIHLVIWDFRFAVRYHIVTVAIIITLLYSSVFLIFRDAHLTQVVEFMIFSDPTMLGFMFIGALILFEKNSRVLSALVITPVKLWQYMWSKAIVLTTIAIFCSLGMAIASEGFAFNPWMLVSGVAGSSVIFVFLGIAGVSRVQSFTQYILIIPLFLAPAVIPLLNFFSITDSVLFYVIPTQATLSLLQFSFEKPLLHELILSLLMLIIWIVISFYWAKKWFRKYTLNE